MSKPRVYIAIATFHPQVGGAERQALLQGCALRAHGYDATIITLRHDRAWPKYDAVEGVPVVRVAGMVLGGREKFPAPLRKLAYLLGVLTMGWVLWWRRKSYDILHVYQLNLLILPAAFVCWLVSKPLIVALRCADSCYRVGSSNDETTSARPCQVKAPSSLAKDGDRSRGDLEALESLGKPIVGLTRYLLKRANAVMVVLTLHMQKDLTEHGLPIAGVRVIPNGVDLAHFRPAGPAVRPLFRAGLVLFVGRLTFQKGIDVLLTAWRDVQEHLPHSQRARLVIVGTGPLRARLESLSVTLGIADSVEFVGVQVDVAAWLRSSDVVVLPSRWEGMPNSLLEAMASGLPCIATRVSGSEELIQHGINGLLVERDDDAGLAQALLSVLQNPVLGGKYGCAARLTIEEHYSLDHVMGAYLDLYHSLYGDTLRPGSKAVI